MDFATLAGILGTAVLLLAALVLVDSNTPAVHRWGN